MANATMTGAEIDIPTYDNITPQVYTALARELRLLRRERNTFEDREQSLKTALELARTAAAAEEVRFASAYVCMMMFFRCPFVHRHMRDELFV